MKIIYLHQYFNTPDMVGGTRSYEMARRLVVFGHEVHMVTTWREPADRQDWFIQEVNGIHVHWLPVPYSNHMGIGGRMRAFFRFAMHAGQRAIGLGGDVIFATSTPLTIAIPAVQAARKLTIPMVFEVRDLWPEIPIAIGALRNPLARKAALWLERFSYQNSERIIALSDGMAAGVIRTGYPREKLHVISNSADIELFADKGTGNEFRSRIPELGDRILITYPGTLGEINGVGYLVDIAAAAMTAAPELRFAIVGGGKEEEMVKRHAADVGVLNRNLFMFESMPKAKITEVFAGSDVVISLFIDMKPMWANSANKFFDALAAGKPVAINYGGWQAQVLNESGAGIRLPADNPSEAAKMLVDFASHREVLRNAGKAARKLAEVRYSRDKLALEMEQVLRAAVQHWGGRHS